MKLKFKDKQEFEEFKALFDQPYIFPYDHPTEISINDIKRAIREVCPECLENGVGVLENYDPMWHDGDINCKQCGTYIRMYDAG